MKFKTKDDLMIYPGNKNGQGMNAQFNNGIDIAFNSFKERIDFYNRFRSQPAELSRRNEDAYKLWEKHKKEKVIHSYDKQPLHMQKYYFNSWLFNYCFGDIE